MSASTDAARWYERVRDEAREGRGAWLGEVCRACSGFIPPRDLPKMQSQRKTRFCRCAMGDGGAPSSDLFARHGLASVAGALVVQPCIYKGAFDA